jgi:hypothetical protein
VAFPIQSILYVSSSLRARGIQEMHAISLQAVLEAVGEFDDSGGASAGLVAWELCISERLVRGAWEQARATGLIAPAGFDQHEQLWRLTAAGWAAHRGVRDSA